MPLKGYGTPTEIAILCGYDQSDPSVLEEVTLALELVEEEIDQYCSTTFENEEGVSKFYDGTGTSMLTLGFYLRSLDTVWVIDEDGNRSYELTGAVPQPSSPRNGCYRWLQMRDSIDYGTRVSQQFPVGLRNLEVIGDWGFESCPGAIKQAAALSVKHFFNLRNMDATKLEEFSINRNVKFVTGKDLHYLHPAAMKALDKWKNSRWMCE